MPCFFLFAKVPNDAARKIWEISVITSMHAGDASCILAAGCYYFGAALASRRCVNIEMRGILLLSRLVNSFMNILLPPLCVVCGAMFAGGQRHGNLCQSCLEEIRPLLPPLCRLCGMELYETEGRNSLCGECLKQPPPYSIARSVLRYNEPVQKMIHRLKYGADLSVLPGFAQLTTCFDMTEFVDIDCVVPVPLHLKRLRRRGLNQAVLLARLFFADRLTLVHPDWLKRTRNTPSQTGLDRRSRRENLRGAFHVPRNRALQGAVVCLVDDVFTTGSTAGECSKVLLDSGAGEVRVLTLARVDMPRRGRQL